MSRRPDELRRRMYLSNTIYWMTLLLLGFYIGTQLLFDFNRATVLNTFDDWVPLVLFLVSILSLLLNKRNYGKISRTVFLLTWILTATILPILLSKISPSSYLIHPLLCILMSLMIHLFFSWYEDRWLYILFLTTSFLLTSFSYYFLSAFDTLESFQKLPVNTLHFEIVYAMSWVFINLTLIYVYRINWRAYLELQNKNEIIENLNKSLETKVEKRTRVLHEQNAKLMEYAFVNSHILRAPVSRILGLVQLLKKSNSETQGKEILNHLEESSKELDTVVRKLSITLQEARDEEKFLE